MRRNLCCLLVLLSLATNLPAQQKWLFSHFGKKEGLASDFTNCTQQDSSGYIWIATTAGLYRFDGQRFVLFRHKPDKPTTIPNDQVQQLQIDDKNRLWILCAFNELGYMDVREQKFHQVNIRLKDKALKTADGMIFRTAAGKILFLAKNYGAFGFDEVNQEFSYNSTPFPVPHGWKPMGISQDSLSSIFWIGCDSGIVKYNPRTRHLSYRGHNIDKDPIIERLSGINRTGIAFADHSGRFWVNPWPPEGPQRLVSLDTRTGKIREWDSVITVMLKYKYHDVNYFNEMRDGSIWIGGNNMLVFLRPGSDKFESLESQLTGEFNLHYDEVQHLLEDREHNIWISTDKGLYRFNPQAQVFHTITNRIPGRDTVYTPDVTDILQAQDGKIYVSTWGNGVFVYDSNFKAIPSPVAFRSRHNKEIMTWCIHQRPNGDIWRGNQDGFLAIYHSATGFDERLDPPICRRSTIRQIVEDARGDIWLATQKGDLIRWTAATNSFSLVRNLGSSVQRMITDRHGDIWACTVKQGLYNIDATDGSILHHYTVDSPEGERLKDIGATDVIQYSDSIFLVSSGGVLILNEYTHSIKPMDVVNGVPNNAVTNLVMDKKGFVWMASSNGLVKMTLFNKSFSTFNEADGIGSNTFNVAAECLLKDGRIAIGTAHDLMVFHPNQITSENTQPPDVEITNIALMNKWLNMDSVSRLPRLELPYEQNSLRIVFSTLTFQNSFTIMYKLEPLDKNWVTSESMEAIYNYLPPGDYTLTIEARNSVNVASTHRREIRIRVIPPFWKTWGFYAFIALAFAGILYWFDRQRMKRKAGLQKIRSSISDSLHEEIHTTLQHINVLSEIARIKAEKSPEQSINYISEIQHKSRSMIIALEDMLWSIDPANDTMAQAIARMKEFAGALRQKTGVDISFHEDDKVLALKPDMRIRHELMLVYKLSMRLLVEEMKARQATVQLDFERSQLSLSLFAAGMRPDNGNHSVKLLEEMKARARSIGGTLDLQFDDKGAAIIFICPSIS